MYSDIFLTHCVFQELGMRKTIGTRHKQNELYELELASDQVACISTSSAFHYHFRLGHHFLLILKLHILSLGQILFLACEFIN